MDHEMLEYYVKWYNKKSNLAQQEGCTQILWFMFSYKDHQKSTWHHKANFGIHPWRWNRNFRIDTFFVPWFFINDVRGVVGFHQKVTKDS
jgi:hypothetical protein